MTTRVRAQMPEADPRPKRGRGWWIPVLGFALLAIATFAWAWSVALHPNGYAGHRFREGDTFYAEANGQWRFPIEQLLEVGQWMLVEVGLVTLTLFVRTHYTVHGRTLLLGGIMVGFAMLMTLPLIMHGSAPYPQFLAFQFVGAIGLILYGLVSKGLARPRPVR
jgi:hypothetical protein